MKEIQGRTKQTHHISEIPSLVELQLDSYQWFLEEGLHELFASFSPIYDFTNQTSISLTDFTLGEPKYSLEECRDRDMTFEAPIKSKVLLKQANKEEIESEVYLGDLPLMTDKGTFIINGAERVVVSQLARSPGVYFKDSLDFSGKVLFFATIIPQEGAWVDVETDNSSQVTVRIGQTRKFPLTTLLRALNAFPQACLPLEMPIHEILERSWIYKTVEAFDEEGKQLPSRTEKDFFLAMRIKAPIVDKKTGEIVAEEDALATEEFLKALAEKIGEKTVIKVYSRINNTTDILNMFSTRQTLPSPEPEHLLHKRPVYEIVDEKGKVLVKPYQLIADKTTANAVAKHIAKLPTPELEVLAVNKYVEATLDQDVATDTDSAMLDIYRKIRPGDPATLESARSLVQNIFFDARRYDMAKVGRYKMNKKLGSRLPLGARAMTKEDLVSILRYIINLNAGEGTTDDIDHLENKRIRSVGELLASQLRMGFLRMEKVAKERMTSLDNDNIIPQVILSVKPISASIKSFFGSSQLSQFMDQTNPLAELVSKRRLSALGPGGLSRQSAKLEVRDVHESHYGRICPIETPEGPNIGLINSLATYAKVNKYGFIETPYRLVRDGQVQDGWKYLSAMEEEKLVVAQADAPTDKEGNFTNELVSVRKQGDFRLVKPQDVTAVDVSPRQLVSVAAALIPFLENDDANRALMGSNMQRQAVPLIRADAPLVGTGMEAAVARDSGATIVAKRPGVVDQIDGARIVVRATAEDGTTHGVDIYRLRKYMRSNQSTCINQRPLVKVGDRVNTGDIIADGPSTDLGELALGRNVLCAFMPWNGYNFEDSILISERIARDDVFTSIHIEEFELMARDTKLGQEEITRDIPNVGEEALRNLDEAGIVYIGAEVNPGDILVGKVTPKGESPMTPEEKLLRAIFGEKASDVRDTSLKLPPGVTGTIVDVRVFSRRGVDKDERAMAIERSEIERLAKDRDDERAIQERSFLNRMREKLLNRKASAGFKGIKSGTVITDEVLAEHPRGAWRNIAVSDDAVMAEIETLKREYDEAVRRLQARFDGKVEKLQRGDELPPGVMKMVKVFVAVKRKLQPGDKMAGRHGNKGVVSRVTPVEDMPFLEDGTHVDLVLNPLGVPSRMNVGQILETHLGWACATLGKQVGELVDEYRRTGAQRENLLEMLRDIYGDAVFAAEIEPMSTEQLLELSDNLKKGIPIATPVFDGARMSDIEGMLTKAGLNTSGQVFLTDGRTGETFERKVTVGYIYMLKLHHLVDDKIHARSIGPYSLVTQQPLGGKAQFGGQRFGEMECWALEAYGAAYTLQEMLTVKSDDVSGRTKVYEAIVREQDTFEAGIPESFNVLVKELKSLGLNVDLDMRPT